MLRSFVIASVTALSLSIIPFAARATAPVAGGDTGTPSRSPATPPAAIGDALQARGRYVAIASDCIACHTAPGGKPFAGGNSMQTPFGKFYGPNITPDVGTGIGSWSQKDFENALRLGVRKDGKYLYPAMPYGSFTKLNAADMDALWAYIRNVPAVANVVPANTLPFPLTIREALAVWQSLYFKPGLFQPAANRDEQWNRGAYLVNAMGHCSDCHTPRNLAQGPEQQHLMSGAEVEGWYAPDISSRKNSNVARWPVTTLAKYLKTGSMPNNTKAFGPMQETIHDSLSHLDDADLLAMAVYLKSQGTSVSEAAPSAVKLSDDSALRGRLVYENNCLSCHQAHGEGTRSTVPSLAGNDAVSSSEPYNVIMALLEGFPPQGDWGAMGSFADSLSDDQIADVANYVRTTFGNRSLANATPWGVERLRAYAQSPKNESRDLLCPNLPDSVIKPALAIDSNQLFEAAHDRLKMMAAIGSYRTARPAATQGEVVEALSTAYCRGLARGQMSEARMGAEIADFAQQIALTMRGKKA